MEQLLELRRWLNGEILKAQSASRDTSSNVLKDYLSGQEVACNKAIKKIDDMLAEAPKP